MKNLILFLALAVLELNTTAQQSKSDILIKNTCACIDNYNPTDMDYNQLVQKLGTCMASDLIAYYDELKEELGITTDDYSEGMQQIGEKLGARLAVECPKFMELSLKMVQQNDDLKNDVLDHMNDGYTSAPKQIFTGKVDKVKLDALTGIIVKSGDESLYFVWLGKFTGSEQYEKDPESLKGKDVTITYTEAELYDGVAKTYVKKRVIAKLEVH